jgi:hypothetical protein
MTYAEQFNAPSWLEDASQWLWWTMQSRINGNLQDAQYNLKQFWTALEEVKRNATEATWPEIMALDAQSHIQAANVTSAIIGEMEGDISTVSAWVGAFGWSGMDSKAAIKKMQDQRSQELETAASLASQARTATAARVQSVADGRLSYDEAERAKENKDIESIISSNSSLDLLGVPIWAWAAGAAALFLLLKVK